MGLLSGCSRYVCDDVDVDPWNRYTPSISFSNPNLESNSLSVNEIWVCFYLYASNKGAE